jgi:uncharacterized protein YdeI (BOF family)
MMRFASVGAVVLLLAACSRRDATTLGTGIEGVSVPVASIPNAPMDSPVQLRGTMTKKCPVAGCWFMLQDETGTIKVDTKNAGFAVVDVPLNSRVAVTGRVVTNGTERLIDATGVRY